MIYEDFTDVEGYN